MKTILICGGRRFGDLTQLFPETEHDKRRREYDFIWTTLDRLWEPDWTRVIAGGATGADTVGVEWALSRGILVREYLAEWNKFGKRAGILRNVRMLEEGRPDTVVAFPGGNGTAHMTRIAREAGVQVHEIEYLGT